MLSPGDLIRERGDLFRTIRDIIWFTFVHTRTSLFDSMADRVVISTKIDLFGLVSDLIGIPCNLIGIPCNLIGMLSGLIGMPCGLIRMHCNLIRMPCGLIGIP